jgi:hypothetical protein
MFNEFGDERVRGRQTKRKELHEERFNSHFSPNFIKVINSRNKEEHFM